MSQEERPKRQPPTRAELAETTDRLLAEIDTAFATDRWAIVRSGTEQVTWRMYDGAALRYCAQLLRELAAAIDAGIVFGARTLTRSLVEAAMLSLYIHFGKYPAVTEAAQAARHSLEGLQKETDEVNARLQIRKQKAHRSAKRVRASNGNVARHNAKHPHQPKAMIQLPHEPQLEPSRIDLSALLAGFDSFEAQSLPVATMIDQLSEWAPKLGFGQEDLRPVYLSYRILSMLGGHASLHVLHELVDMPPNSHFARIKTHPDSNEWSLLMWGAGLYYTSFAAEWVLSSAGCDTSEIKRIREWSAPLPSGRAPWMDAT